MEPRSTTVFLFFSVCAVTGLMTLCSTSHAGGFGRAGGDYSAPVRSESSSESTEAAKKIPPEEAPVPDPPQEQKKEPEQPPDQAQDAFPKELPVPNVRWIDTPGNDLKLAAYIAAGLAAAPLAGGIYCTVKTYGCTGYFCGLGYVWAGVSFGIAGLLLVSALSFGLAGDARAEEEQVASKHPGFEPFFNPLLEKKNDNVSLTGAVVGLKGSF